MSARWLLLALPSLIQACGGKDPDAPDFVGRWTARVDAHELLKGRLPARSTSLTLNSDGTASFDHVPNNLYSEPPGPQITGTGTWRLAKSSGRTVLVGTVTSDGRSLGLEFGILPGKDAAELYVDLTDPDQMERFVYVKEASRP